MQNRFAIRPTVFIVAALVSVGIFLLSASAKANNESVDPFLRAVKREAPIVGQILVDYSTHITSQCHVSPTVDDLKRFAQHSPHYVDLLGYKTLAVDKNAYANSMRAIGCEHFQTLRYFPVKKTRL